MSPISIWSVSDLNPSTARASRIPTCIASLLADSSFQSVSLRKGWFIEDEPLSAHQLCDIASDLQRTEEEQRKYTINTATKNRSGYIFAYSRCVDLERPIEGILSIKNRMTSPANGDSSTWHRSGTNSGVFVDCE